MRLSRVSGRFASAIHSTYSRLQLGLKAAKTDDACLFFFKAAVNSGGASIDGFCGFTTLRLAAIGLVYWPLSTKAAAWRIHPSIRLSEGRSFKLVMRPRAPIHA